MARISLCLVSFILCCLLPSCAADYYEDGRGDGAFNGLHSPATPHQQQNPMADLCRNCVINHGVGFAPFPGRCDAYVQCMFYGDIPTSMNIRRCPGGLYWNQDKLTCDWPDNVECTEIDNCPNQRPSPGEVFSYEEYSGEWSRVQCPSGFAYSDITCGCTDKYQQTTPYTPLEKCNGLKPIVGDPTGFLQRTGSQWVRMPCSPNMVYNEGSCTCVRGPEEKVDDRCRPKLQILFEGSVEDTSVNNFWINNTGVTVDNGNGVFSGKSKLTIPGLSNVDLGETLYVRLRFQQNRATDMQTLIANGDCEVPPSVSICSSSSSIQATVQTSTQTSPTILHGAQNVNVNWWQDVLLMVDNNQTQMLTFPGNGQYPTPIEGSIIRRPRGLVIGGGGSCEYFTGLIDEVEVFTCRPSNL